MSVEPVSSFKHLQTSKRQADRRPERVAKSARVARRSFLAFFFAPNSKCIPFWQGQQSSAALSPLPSPLPPSRCQLVAGRPPIQSSRADNCQTIPSFAVLSQQQQINANPAAQFSLYALLTNGCPTAAGRGWTDLSTTSGFPILVSEPLADFSNPLGAL